MPNPPKEKEDLVTYILNDHTQSLKELNVSISKFIACQAAHDEVLKKHSEALLEQSQTLKSLIEQIGPIKESVKEIETIKTDVKDVKKTNKIALAIYGIILFVGPSVMSIVFRKLMGW